MSQIFDRSFQGLILTEMGLKIPSNGAEDDSEDWLFTARDAALGGGSLEAVSKLLDCYAEAEADKREEVARKDRERAGIPERWVPPKKS